MTPIRAMIVLPVAVAARQFLLGTAFGAGLGYALRWWLR